MDKHTLKLAKWFARAEHALTRKQAQRALKKAEKHYRKLQEKSNDQSFSTDHND